MRLRARPSDIAVAAFVVLVVGLLVVPLPSFLLDLLLVSNIAFAALLLIVTLYVPSALSLLAFPTLLLLTTLLRLGLNVASTRLILADGYAGAVIESFGTFLIRGEVALGVIIFLIVTLVNFLVIARGAARVSEVGARFALDALPGKQMAIDSDVRAGLIPPSEAQVRRDKLRQESQLYGAMDGAMRFVQGDAIAGLVIIAVNVMGGMYFGLTRGMSVSEAVETYTLLTVGDGLVNQIPAILISICSGVVVTRVASTEGSTLGRDLGEQLFERPGAIAFAGGLSILLAAVPGIPVLPFLLVGSALLIGSALVQRRLQQEASYAAGGAVPGAMLLEAPGSASSSNLLAAPRDTPLVIRVDSRSLYRRYLKDEQRYRTWWNALCAEFNRDTGLVLEEMRVIADDDLPLGHFRVEHRANEVERGVVPAEGLFVETHPLSVVVFGAVGGAPEPHPVFRTVGCWVAEHSATTRCLEVAGVRWYDPLQFIALRLAASFLHHPDEILTSTEIHRRVVELEQQSPGLLRELFQQRALNYSRITEVMRELVRQGVSLREFRQILEAVAGVLCSYPANEEAECSTEEIVASVRRARRRPIVSQQLSRRGTLRVITLAPATRELFEEAGSSPTEGLPLALDPQQFTRLLEGFRAVWEPIRSGGSLPTVVVCDAEIRSRVVAFLRSAERAVRVLSYPELSPDSRLEQIAAWAPAQA